MMRQLQPASRSACRNGHHNPTPTHRPATIFPFSGNEIVHSLFIFRRERRKTGMLGPTALDHCFWMTIPTESTEILENLCHYEVNPMNRSRRRKALFESRNGHSNRPQTSEEIFVEMIDRSGMSLFIDQYDLEWARVPVRGHHETYRLHSKPFRKWLMRDFFRRGKVISQRDLREWIALLEASVDGEQRELANRSIWSEGRKALWIDLGDSNWRTVYVTARSWAVDADPPSLFRRFAHQQPLPEPIPGGSIHDLLTFLPPLTCEGDRLLLLTWVVAALMPMPRPILTLVGPHGSAKSTFSTFLRRLLDPSRVELLGRDARADLPLIFFKHAVPVFDNTDSMTPHEADLFCQAVTGRGIARRKLYTDAEEFILAFQRAIIINGLRLPTNRPDFLDRALIIDLERLAPEQRRVLEHLETTFMGPLPLLLGALLDTITQVLARLPVVSTDGLSRMADFHRVGRAEAEILGSSPAQFDAAYQVAEARQKRGAFDNTLALALLLFARKCGTGRGRRRNSCRGCTRRPVRIRSGSPRNSGPTHRWVWVVRSSISANPWPAMAFESPDHDDPPPG